MVKEDDKKYYVVPLKLVYSNESTVRYAIDTKLL